MTPPIAVLHCMILLANGLLSVNGDLTADIRIPYVLNNRTVTVPPAWSVMTYWDYHVWGSQGPVSPTTLLNYPFLSTIELFTATGGCYTGYPACGNNQRDLFVDPSNPSKGYDFSPLLAAVKAIVDSGYAVYIVTGNVPIAFSTTPVVGTFGVNTSPPDDYPTYSNYIEGLAAAAVNEFGIDTVRNFTFGVLTEYNNPDWYVNSTDEYLKLYDYTACGLENVLGEGRVSIGAHACTQCQWSHGGRGWDPAELPRHAAGVGGGSSNGTNWCTGKKGTPLSFLTDSFYETMPGVPGDLSHFGPEVSTLRSEAVSLGFDVGFRYGIDEGRILSGVDSLPLATRAVGSAYQASFDALLFKLMVYGGIDYYSRWGITTNGGTGVWSWENDVDPVATQIAQLSYRLQGELLIAVSNVSISNPQNSLMMNWSATHDDDDVSFVDGVVSVGPAHLHVLVLRHTSSVNGTGSDSPVVTVCGLDAANATQINGTVFTVGESQANFWPQWQLDATAQHITSYQPGWSPSGEAIMLTNATEIAYFQSRVPTYQKLAEIPQETISVTVTGGCVTFGGTVMIGHEVRLYEFYLP
jgi:hypothetical protein